MQMEEQRLRPCLVKNHDIFQKKKSYMHDVLNEIYL